MCRTILSGRSCVQDDPVCWMILCAGRSCVQDDPVCWMILCAVVSCVLVKMCKVISIVVMFGTDSVLVFSKVPLWNWVKPYHPRNNQVCQGNFSCLWAWRGKSSSTRRKIDDVDSVVMYESSKGKS